MSFRIATTISSDYHFVLDRCLPSWYKSSGASRIDVHLYETSRDHRHRWIMNLIERCKILRQVVRESAGEKLLILDADCLVLQNLESGFSDTKPISIARYPNVNIGVIFLNMVLDWPFQEFFDEFTSRAERYCTQHKSSQGADQNVMIEMLSNRADEVHQLDGSVWNLRCRENTKLSTLLEQYSEIKIAHLIGAGGGQKQQKRWLAQFSPAK